MSERAEAALQDLRQKKRNWSYADLGRILRAWGFVRERKKRRHGWCYRNPEHPDLKIILPEGKSLAPDYAQKIEDVLDKILEREENGGN